MTLGWLGLTDKGWFCEEPHHKGSLLHLRHNVFQAKDVIVFVHGFTGGYLKPSGKSKILLGDSRVYRNYHFLISCLRNTPPCPGPARLLEEPKLHQLLVPVP